MSGSNLLGNKSGETLYSHHSFGTKFYDRKMGKAILAKIEILNMLKLFDGFEESKAIFRVLMRRIIIEYELLKDFGFAFHKGGI